MKWLDGWMEVGKYSFFFSIFGGPPLTAAPPLGAVIFQIGFAIFLYWLVITILLSLVGRGGGFGLR